MNAFATCLLILATLALGAGCSSTKSQRIQQNEALFNSYTPAERQMIRTGQVAVGFDQEMVRMALGDPNRESTVETAGGKAIVWEYTEIKPKLGVSLGAGTWGGGGLGGGVGVSASPDRNKVLKRIVFDRQTGKVSQVESYD